MLDLGRADSVATYIDHIINAAADPIAPVLIPNAAIACQVKTWIRSKVHIQHPVVIPINCAQHTRPTSLHAENPGDVVPLKLLPCRRIQDSRFDAEEWECCGTWFHFRAARYRGEHVPSGFRLPECVHYGALGFAHALIVPSPCLGIDRFSHCSKNSQGT